MCARSISPAGDRAARPPSSKESSVIGTKPARVRPIPEGKFLGAWMIHSRVAGGHSRPNDF